MYILFLRFINSFLESSENLQQRLYLQAELFQAGFEPDSLAKVRRTLDHSFVNNFIEQ